jgi:hypothetical protein
MDHRFWKQKRKGKSDKYFFKYGNTETLGPFSQQKKKPWDLLLMLVACTG